MKEKKRKRNDIAVCESIRKICFIYLLIPFIFAFKYIKCSYIGNGIVNELLKKELLKEKSKL